ncbi:hypothetical protein Syun_014686 [Stephania yunnanensis]|uniref:Uncharacterized protein n=1 Tax=Stephania yunnanensis TaxID=152371 RepID=A0AAP0PC60_9MAGN
MMMSTQFDAVQLGVVGTIRWHYLYHAELSHNPFRSMPLHNVETNQGTRREPTALTICTVLGKRRHEFIIWLPHHIILMPLRVECITVCR